MFSQAVTLPINKSAYDIIYSTGKKIETEQFLFACRGSFNSSITDNILFLTEGNLLELDSPKVAKKVYYLMIEGLQNITRHQYHDDSGSPFDGALFIINRREQAYSITYGNWVSAAVKEDLEKNLAAIVSKDVVELKEYYMEILNNSGFSSKGGAVFFKLAKRVWSSIFSQRLRRSRAPTLAALDFSVCKATRICSWSPRCTPS